MGAGARHGQGVVVSGGGGVDAIAGWGRWGRRLIYRSCLAFDRVVLHQLPRPPIVRVCRSMGVCCASHQLLLSFASRVRLMGVCCTSHQLPSFASRV